ncbi:MAG: hypothetical protein NVS3B12_08920 [Acidimicrobiales bacterium]
MATLLRPLRGDGPRVHGPLRPLELAEGAVMADLCVALCLLGWLIPVGGLLIALAVIPMAALSARNRLRTVLAAAVAGITASFLVIGTGLAINVAVCACVGAVVGIAVERGWSRTRAVVSAVVVLGLPATSLAVGVLALLGELRRLTLVQLTNGWRGVARLLQRSGFADAARVGDHVVSWLVRHWPLATASTILGVLAATTWLAYGLTKPTLARLLGAVPRSLAFPPDDAAVLVGPVPVRLEEVRYRYPGRDRDALDGVDLSLDPGRFVAVVGRNGSGKSTLGRVLAGLPVSGGRLTRPGSAALGRRGGTAVVFQRPETQVLGVTAADDVVWGLPASQQPDVPALLGRVGLEGFEGRETSTLSGGELQRLALAAALARQPALLIADEATAMVDPGGRTEIVDVLRAAADDGITVVHVTHRLAETDRADEVVHMEDGHLGVGVPPLDASCDAGFVPRPPGPTILRLAGVGHTYGAGTPWAHRALRDVDLDLRKGEGVLILGRNGSGKSTLAWILAGLLVPSEGAADLEGIPVASRVGAVALSFQHARLQLLRPTVGEDVRAASGADVADAEASLRLVGLEPSLFMERPVDQLSGGEQRRAALAGLLAGRPEVMVLDEPFAGLDAESRRDLADTLGGLRARTRVTLIVVSHDTEGFEGVTDRVVHLEAGRVVADSAPSAVPEGPGQRASSAVRWRRGRTGTGRRSAELHLLRVVPGSSAVHRLWAGTKLVCLVAVALTLSVHPSWLAIAVMGGVIAAGIVLAGIPRGAVPRLPRWFWIGIVFGAVLTAVAGGPPDVHVAGSVVGIGALGDWARVTALAAAVIAAAALVSWTTPVSEVAPAVSRLGRPLRAVGLPVDEWATAIGLSFRCLPLLLDEIRTLGAVRRLRNAHSRPLHRDRALPRRARLHHLLDEPMGLLLAALVVALRRAGELASAIDARGGLGMTSADHRRPAAADAVTIVVVTLAVVVALLG